MIDPTLIRSSSSGPASTSSVSSSGVCRGLRDNTETETFEPAALLQCMVCVFFDAKISQMYRYGWGYGYGLTLEKRSSHGRDLATENHIFQLYHRKLKARLKSFPKRCR
ncbi:hypothetical protein Rs2_01331 [Raphanus sativus]|nr:hypothetical protein Rs2_20040 [Raphanus sativus]KAJ4915781.1 hypothetical protein Rs2_01331 [Raphanus sativus]